VINFDQTSTLWSLNFFITVTACQSAFRLELGHPFAMDL
jgi:hypothetical protein